MDEAALPHIFEKIQEASGKGNLGTERREERRLRITRTQMREGSSDELAGRYILYCGTYDRVE